MLLVKSMCKRCIYEYMRKHHLAVTVNGYKAWLKRHESEFDKWLEQNFGKSRKVPCPRKAEELSNQAIEENSSAKRDLIINMRYPPLQFYYYFAYANKPPETCPYALEHMVSRSIDKKEKA